MLLFRTVRRTIFVLVFIAAAAAAYLFLSIRTPQQVTPSPQPPQKPPSGGQLVLAHPGMVENLFPLQVVDPATRLAGNLIHEPLAARGPTGTLQPVLASTWQRKNDGRSWLIHLRAGVKWHDGDPFTAEDVVQNLQAAAREGTPSPLAPLFGNLKAVQKVDQHAVRIDLHQPRGTLPQLATIPLAHPGKLGGYSRISYNYQATGTGPFQMKRWSPHTETVLVANEDYWGGAPHLDGIKLVPFDDTDLRVRAVQTGYAHASWVGSQQEIPSGLLRDSVPSWDVVYMALPPGSPLLTDRTVRQTIDGILRLTASEEGFPFGLMATGPWPHDAPLKIADQTEEPPDAEQLRSMLDEAGWSRTEGEPYRSKGDHSASLGLLVPVWRSLPQMAKWLSRTLADYGIRADIEEVDLQVMQQRLVERDYQAALVQVRSGPDPDIGHILSSEAAAGGYNDALYANPEMDALVKDLRQLPPEEQSEVAGQILQILKTDVPAVWLHWPRLHIIRRPGVKGLQWAVGPTLWQPHRIYLQPEDGGS